MAEKASGLNNTEAFSIYYGYGRDDMLKQIGRRYDNASPEEQATIKSRSANCLKNSFTINKAFHNS